jgi:hypothetical protein
MPRPILALSLLAFACGGGSSNNPPPPVQNPPAAPSNLVATAANARVALSWTAVEGATSYLIFRQSSVDASPAQIGTSTTSSFVDPAVKNGEIYRYTVRTVTALGTSADSRVTRATPLRLLCVADGFNDRIAVFNADVANIFTPPISFGSATGLNPASIDVDPVHGEIFSANLETVTTHPVSAHGDAPPVRTLISSTSLDVVYDADGDDLIVVDFDSTDTIPISTFSRTASGNAAPVRTLNVSGSVRGAALSGAARGDRMFLRTNDNRIFVYGRTDTGDVPPAATISVSSTLGPIAYDPATNEIIVVALTATGFGIEAFPASSSGSTSPSRVLQGDQTTLSLPEGIALDVANRRLYVSDTGRILVFPADFGAVANIAPTSVLAGPSTQFANTPGGDIVFDPVRHTLIVTALSRILTFDANASGDVAPLSSISSFSSGIERPSAIAFDHSSREVLVANAGAQPSIASFDSSELLAAPSPKSILSPPVSGFSSLGVAVDETHGEIFTFAGSPPVIEVFRSGASATEAPLRTIGSLPPLVSVTDIAYDAINDAIVVNGAINSPVVVRFDRNAQGSVAPLTTLAVDSGFDGAIAVDNKNGELFVPVVDGVNVYRLTDDGTSAPIRQITGINGPEGAFVDTDNDELFLSAGFGGVIEVFSRTASGAAAPLRLLNIEGAILMQAGRLAVCN